MAAETSHSSVDVEPGADDDLTAEVLARSAWVRAPQQARSEATLRAIVDAADALIAERGFAGVSVDDIVDQAERTVGSFYARFDDKTGVLRVLAERDWELMHQAARRFWSVERWHERPLDDVLRASAEVVVRRYRSVTPVLREAASLATTDRAFRAQRRAALVQVGVPFAEVMADHASEITHPDPVRAGALAFTAMFALLEFRRSFGDVLGGVIADDAALVDTIYELLVSIVGPVGSA